MKPHNLKKSAGRLVTNPGIGDRRKSHGVAEPLDDAVLTLYRLQDILDPSDVPAHCAYIVDVFTLAFGADWVERALGEYRDLPEPPANTRLKVV